MARMTPVENKRVTDEELAIVLARLSGVEIATERLSAVAEAFRTLRERAVELNDVDLDRYEPAMRFDAHWPESER